MAGNGDQDRTVAPSSAPSPNDFTTIAGEHAPVPSSEGPGAIIGPYKLLQLIGEGGFGSVFLAEQEKPVRRRVALKIIKLGMDTRQVIARFEAERQALALMDHPNIAKVLDAGATHTGRPYFVMELVKGVPITDYCDSGKLTIPDCLALFVQVCRAVQHAHQKGVIHRDLKPSNVLVAIQDRAPQVKVIDFGIAKATAGRLTERTLFTEQRAFVGTPEYMSPEQAEGSLDIDTRTDVYSLGVLLYELLTGQTPFDAKSLRSAAYGEVQRIIREVDPPRPSTRLSRNDTAAHFAARRRTEPKRLSTILRADLDWVVMRAMEKERSRRYDSPGSLADDIERYLRDEPVVAGPPTTAYKLKKFVRRNRRAVVTTAVFAVVVLGLIGFLVEEYVRAERMARIANANAQAAHDAAAASQRDAEFARLAQGAEADQRRTAETQRDKARAAFGFVYDMFNAIDPRVAKGREITVREVLDSAASRAASELQGQPEVEGNVRDALGQAYYHLARYPEAEESLRRAHELRAKTLGPLHRETLTTLNNLGACLIELDRAREAVPVLERAAADRAEALGPADPDTLASRSLLAFAMQLTGDLEGAERTIRETIAAQSDALGRANRDTLESRCGLADVLRVEGKIDEAVREGGSLVADAVVAFGQDEVITIQARSIYAVALKEAGREPEAETILRAVVASKTKIYGPDRAETLVSEDSLANTLRNQKKLDEAETIGRSVVERARRALGVEDQQTLSYRNNLAQTLRTAGKFSEAESLFKAVLEARRRINGPEHLDTLIALNNLGMLYGEMGRPAEALPIQQEAATGLEKTLSPDHWMTALARLYTGESLAALGRFEEAEPLIVNAYNTVKTARGPTHPRTREAAHGAADLYEKWGKPDEAAKWKSLAAQ